MIITVQSLSTGFALISEILHHTFTFYFYIYNTDILLTF